MKQLAIGFVIAFVLVGCLREQPPKCIGGCARVPDLEPLGKLCTLSSSSCKNGVLTCIYSCVDVESGRIPLDVEIRSTPTTKRE